LSAPRWSVIIPAFNEARRLPRYLDEIVGFFDGRGEPYEVLISDDGSTDETAEVVRAIMRAHSQVKLLRGDVNRGKGDAVRRGMLAATGDLRLFADADGATPISELKRLEAALQAGADIAIGSRVKLDPGVSVTARAHRVAAGRVFNWLVSWTGLAEIQDSQCGFKAFTAAAARDLFRSAHTRGFGFDVEVLLMARARGWRIAEVAVNWSDQPGSKSSVLADGPRMLREIMLAWLRIHRRP
jgi:dolichyl-phosphate beta-glucosyltransferase